MRSTRKPTIFLRYGFCEGPRIGRYCVRALESVGFQHTTHSESADIFVGHSGGCLQPSESGPTQLVVLIGFPYWPGKSLASALLKKNRREYVASGKNHTRSAWWQKLGWNCIYFWNMRQNLAMMHAVLQGPVKPQARQTLCIRNRDDDFCTPSIWQQPALSQTAFLSVDGGHDDLWMHPEVYAAIIKAYYGTNILAPSETE